MPDLSALVAARDNLNAHIGVLVAQTNVPQSTIDNLATEANKLDADVVAATQAPPPPPPANLDFSKLDAAVAAFKAVPNQIQQNVDNLTFMISQNTPK